jgi:hypothetical protein
MAITGSGALSFSQDFASSGGGSTLTINPTLSVGRDLTISGGTSFTSTSSITVTRDFTHSSSTTLTMGSLTVGRDFKTTNGGAIAISGNVSIDRDFTISGGAGISIGGSLTVNKDLTMDNNGTLTVSGVVNIDRNTSLSGGADLILNGSSASLGDVTITGGSTLTGTSPYVDFSSMNFSNGSTLCTQTTTTGVTALGSPVNLGTCATVLPITLKSFKVNYLSGDFYFDWITLTEIDNDFFTLEYSTDAESFVPFATVKGAGYSYQELSYSFTESNLNTNRAEVIYFRLKQTDFDGKFAYSHIVPVSLTGKEIKLFALYPNPTEGKLVLRLEDWTETSSASFSIYNTISHENIEVLIPIGVETEFNLSHLAKGVYIIEESTLGIREKLVID